MKPMRAISLIVALIAAVALVTCGAWADRAPKTAAYRLQTTGNVQLSLPPIADLTQVLYRDASGKWSSLPVDISDDALHLRIEVAKIKNGRTMIILNVPEGVNMDDQEPPRVVRFEIDGKDHGTVQTVALGGVEMAPRNITVEVKDDLNSLQTRSLLVTVNGRRYTLRDAGVSFERISPKHGIVSVDVGELLDSMSSDNTVTVRIDDYALDEDSLNCSLSFRYTPPYKLPDGSLLAVDTVTSSSGWAEWWVVVDGIKMDASSGTTAGCTWLSEQSAQPHWIRLEFPEARKVSGVALWWSHYQCFRTSVAYEVQTWDGEAWVTQVQVKDQGEIQCSKHAFEPVTTTAVRVWQPSMSGHPGRADYMWLSEIEVL